MSPALIGCAICILYICILYCDILYSKLIFAEVINGTKQLQILYEITMFHKFFILVNPIVCLDLYFLDPSLQLKKKYNKTIYDGFKFSLNLKIFLILNFKQKY